MATKIYVGCALKDLPENEKAAFLVAVDSFKDSLRENKYDVLEFLGLGDNTPEKVYKTDIGCVDSCDVFIGLCEFPSIGLGMEIMRAIERDKRVILIGDEKSSKMPQGAPSLESNVVYLYCEARKDWISLSLEALK